MLMHEVLHKDKHNRVKYRTEGWNTANADIILDQIRFATDYFDKSLLGTDAARMAHITASVNGTAMKKVHSLCTKFFYDLLAIQKDPENLADIPIFIDMMMNVMDSKNLPAK